MTYDPDMGSPAETVRQSAMQLRKALQDQAMAKATVIEELVQGSWWQFVVNQTEGSVISLMTITLAHGQQWKIRRRPWTNDGKEIAVYKSRTAAFDPAQSRMYYYWDGEHQRDKALPVFFRVGEIQFEEPVGAKVQEGAGWHSFTAVAKLGDTARKSARYRRVTTEDLIIVKSGDPAAMERLLAQRVADRNALQI